jgi:hypothetical protein
VTTIESDLLRRQAYLDGKWVDADSGDTFPVASPATGEESDMSRERSSHGIGRVVELTYWPVDGMGAPP